MSVLHVADLAGVAYSGGRAFDGLSVSRAGTENFLRSGSLDGITSRSDLSLLEDLRDAAQRIVDHRGSVDADFVCDVNRAISRSGALHPGHLRGADQQITVVVPLKSAQRNESSQFATCLVAWQLLNDVDVHLWIG